MQRWRHLLQRQRRTALSGRQFGACGSALWARLSALCQCCWLYASVAWATILAASFMGIPGGRQNKNLILHDGRRALRALSKHHGLVRALRGPIENGQAASTFAMKPGFVR
jgi:hypothetical protein